MKIKVLHVVQTLETGGLENGVINLANKIDHERFIYHILCLRGRGELEDRIEIESVKVFYYPNPRGNIATYINTVFLVCKKEKYHIVHNHGWGTLIPAYIGAKFAGIPFVINGEHGTIYSDTIRRRLLQRIFFNLVNVNLTVSESLKQDLMRIFNVRGKKFIPIINGVDISKFYPDADKRDSMRKELALSPDNFLIGTVGRLVDVKDYPTLVRAFSVLLKKYPFARLIFIGDGDQRDLLQQLIDDYDIANNISLLGRRNNVPELINAMDLFVLSSKSEGISNTLLEAMACGKMVIATNVGGNLEIVVDGKTGLFFKPGDVHNLAGILGEMIDDRRRLDDFSKTAYLHIKQNYSIDKMVKNYEDFYASFCNQC